MSRLTTTLFACIALSLVLLPVLQGQEVKNIGGDDCHVGAPWLSVPLVCPKYPTCDEARMFCLTKEGEDGLTDFSCHAGSVWGYYECATNSFPLTNCTGEVNLNACEQLPVVLGNAEHYSVIAGSAVTNTGLTKIIGDVGVSPGTSVTGFGPGEVLQGSSIDSANLASAAGIFDLSKNPIEPSSLCLQNALNATHALALAHRGFRLSEVH
eukprot:2959088-Rhodomonas_salina.2